MAESFDLDDLATILELLKTSDVTELKLERGNEKLWLKRGEGARQPNSAMATESCLFESARPVSVPTSEFQVLSQSAVPIGTALSPQFLPAAAMQPIASSTTDKTSLRDVTSPMVGTFYRRPAVDAPPYVEVGNMVKKGDVLCIVEAMKLMNEIEAEVSGRVADICLEDGQMVEYGETMFRIDLVE